MRWEVGKTIARLIMTDGIQPPPPSPPQPPAPPSPPGKGWGSGRREISRLARLPRDLTKAPGSSGRTERWRNRRAEKRDRQADTQTKINKDRY